jgi:hypothetical protein
MPWLVWGFCLPTMTLAHATFAINTVNHMFGSRRFETVDESRNNPLTAFFAVGEGGTTTTTAISAPRATASTGGSSIDVVRDPRDAGVGSRGTCSRCRSASTKKRASTRRSARRSKVPSVVERRSRSTREELRVRRSADARREQAINAARAQYPSSESLSDSIRDERQMIRRDQRQPRPRQLDPTISTLPA